MSEKKTSRIRRSVRTRSRISRDRVNRMSIFRTPRHIYAQIIDPSGGRVVASASSLEAEIRSDLPHGGNIAAAASVSLRRLLPQASTRWRLIVPGFAITDG